jgi:uncharacterized protein YjeT (DUF2065 family)
MRQSTEIVLRLIIGPLALACGCLLAYRIDDIDRRRSRRVLLICLSYLLVLAGMAALTFPLYWQTSELLPGSVLGQYAHTYGT